MNCQIIWKKTAPRTSKEDSCCHRSNACCVWCRWIVRSCCSTSRERETYRSMLHPVQLRTLGNTIYHHRGSSSSLSNSYCREKRCTLSHRSPRRYDVSKERGESDLNLWVLRIEPRCWVLVLADTYSHISKERERERLTIRFSFFFWIFLTRSF